MASGVGWLAASDFTVRAAQLEGVASHPDGLWIMPTAATNTCGNSINLVMVITENDVLEAATASDTCFNGVHTVFKTKESSSFLQESLVRLHGLGKRAHCMLTKPSFCRLAIFSGDFLL